MAVTNRRVPPPRMAGPDAPPVLVLDGADDLTADSDMATTPPGDERAHPSPFSDEPGTEDDCSEDDTDSDMLPPPAFAPVVEGVGRIRRSYETTQQPTNSSPSVIDVDQLPDVIMPLVGDAAGGTGIGALSEAASETPLLHDPHNASPFPPSEDEDPPLIALGMPAFERAFRSTIIRPLNSIVNGNENRDNSATEMLIMEIRMKLRSIMRAIYYLAQNGVYGIPSQRGDRPPEQHEEEAFDCVDSEQTARKKLLPHAIRLILKIGVDNKNRNSNFCGYSSHILHPEGEWMAAAILLDFAELSGGLLQLASSERSDLTTSVPENILDYMGHDYLDELCQVVGAPAWEVAMRQRYRSHRHEACEVGEGRLIPPVGMLPPYYAAYGATGNETEVREALLARQEDPVLVHLQHKDYHEFLPPMSWADSIFSIHLLAVSSCLISLDTMSMIIRTVQPESSFMERISVPAFKSVVGFMRSLACALSHLSDCFVHHPEESREIHCEYEVTIPAFVKACIRYINSAIESDLSSSEEKKILLSVLVDISTSPFPALLSDNLLDESLLPIRLQMLRTYIVGDGATLSCQIAGINELKEVIREVETELEDSNRRLVENEQIDSDGFMNGDQSIRDELEEEGDRDRQALPIGPQQKPRGTLRDLELISPRSKSQPPLNGDCDSSTGAACSDDASHGSSTSRSIAEDEDDMMSWKEREGLADTASMSGDSGNRHRHVVAQASPLHQQPDISQSPTYDEMKYAEAQKSLQMVICFLTGDPGQLNESEFENPASPLLTQILTTFPHPELLKRLPPILNFLARNQGLSTGYLTHMWNASGLSTSSKNKSGGNHSAHETVRDGVFSLFISLLDGDHNQALLSQEHLSHLISLLSALESSRYDVPVVNLVVKVVWCSINLIVDGKGGIVTEDNPTGVVGFNLLWDLATESRNSKESRMLPRGPIFDAAVTGLVEMTEKVARNAALGTDINHHPSLSANAKSDMQWLQTSLIRRALDGISVDNTKNLSSQNSAEVTSGGDTTLFRILSTSIRILPMVTSDDITNKYFHDTPSLDTVRKDSRFTSFQDIAQEYDIMSIIVGEIVDYASRSKQAATLSVSKNLDHSVLVGRCFTHFISVSARLELFLLVVGKGLELMRLLSHEGVSPHQSPSPEGLSTISPSSGGQHNSSRRRKRMINRNYGQDSLYFTDGESSPKRSALNVAHPSPIAIQQASDIVPIENDANDQVSIVAPTVIADENKTESFVDKVKCSPENGSMLRNGISSDRGAHYSGGMNTPLPSSDHIGLIWDSLIVRGVSAVTIDVSLRTIHSMLSLVTPGDYTSLDGFTNGTYQPQSVERSNVIQEWTHCLVRTLFTYCHQLSPETLRTSGYELFVNCLGHFNLLNGRYLISNVLVNPTSPHEQETDCPQNRRMNQVTFETMKRMTKVLMGIAHYDVPHQHDDDPSRKRNREGIKYNGSSAGAQNLINIVNYEVHGLKKLLAIAHASDAKVSHRAMVYLSTLYTYLPTAYFSQDEGASTVAMELFAQEQRKFVQECMSTLNGIKIPEHDASYTTLQQIRMLKLIRIFTEFALRSCAVSQEHSSLTLYSSLPKAHLSGPIHAFRSSHGFTTDIARNTEHANAAAPLDSTTGFPIPLSDEKFVIHVKPIQMPTLTLSFPYGLRTSIGFLRSEIKKAITDQAGEIVNPSSETGDDRKYSDLRLIFRGKEIKGSDNETFAALGIEHKGTLHCCLRMQTSGVNNSNTERMSSIGRGGEDPKPLSSSDRAGTLPDGRNGNNQTDTSADNCRVPQPTENVLPESSTERMIQANNVWIDPSMSGICELVSKSHMEQFFSLLSGTPLHGEIGDVDNKVPGRQVIIIRDLVWELLQLLPSDPRLRIALLLLDDWHSETGRDNNLIGTVSFDWNLCLPHPSPDTSVSRSVPSAPYRLLYSLQLVSSLTARASIDPKHENDTSNKVTFSDEAHNLPVKKSEDLSRNSDGRLQNAENDTNFISDVGNREAVSNGKLSNGNFDPDMWSSRFVHKGGLDHLIHLLVGIDLSGILFDSAVESKDGALSSQSTSDGLIMLRCASRLLRLICHFFERDCAEISDTTIGGTSNFGPLLKHVLKLTHWSVTFQLVFANMQKEVNCSSRKSSTSWGPVHASESQASHPLHTSVGDPLSRDEAFSSKATKPQQIECYEEGGNVACQCLVLMKVILQFSNGLSSDEEGETRSCSLLRYCFDPHKPISSSSEKAETHQSSESWHSILSDAIASSLLKSPSENVRCLAASTFRCVFDIRPERQLASKNQPESTPASPQDNELTCVESENDLKCIGILSILVDLLPLGSSTLNIHGNKTSMMSRCSNLFELVVDTVIMSWDVAEDATRKLAIEDFLVQIEQGPSSKHLYKEKGDGTSTMLPPACNDVKSFGALLFWLMNEICNLQNRERRSTTMASHSSEKWKNQQNEIYCIDYYLVGTLQLTKKVVEVMGSMDVKLAFGGQCQALGSVCTSFIEVLFNKCAFALPSCAAKSISDSTWISPQTREIALSLMLELCRSCAQNIKVLSALLLTRHHDFRASSPRTDILNEWHYDPLSRQKSTTGYVGMKNQGATCYLNSLLQQFSLIRPLREGILTCSRGNKQDHDESRSDSLLSQLQLLFANLAVSEKRDYDTQDLCSSIRGYDGEPIRPHEQQDVDEFFALFCDRLESELKPFKERGLLQDVFGGKLGHVITCQECKHRSERSEECLAISLDVKGKKNILESLDLYTQGETLDGSNQYYCSQCCAKQDSVKMCCVADGGLPNTLILHLKRFEFDLEAMAKVKVNDRCEFPTELNMKPYTMEGLNFTDDKPASHARDDGYYIYNLRGVLVHTGTADSGHYYSLARGEEVNSSESEGTSEEANQNSARGTERNAPWFCFNDSIVTPFDPETLPDAAFGGSKASSKYDHITQKMLPTEIHKPYSAYLLIYERDDIEFRANDKDTEEVVIETANNPKQKENQNDSHISSDQDSSWHPRYTDFSHAPHEVIPDCIIENLANENQRFLHDQTFFDPEYSNWLLNLAQCSPFHFDGKPCAGKEPTPSSVPMELLQALTHHLFENLIHAKDRMRQIDTYTSTLCSWYATSSEACVWLLELMCGKYESWVVTVLLQCPIVEVRQNIVRLLTIVFQRMSSFTEHPQLYEVEDNDQNKLDDHDMSKLAQASSGCQRGVDDSGESVVLSADEDSYAHDQEDDVICSILSDSGQQTTQRLGRVRWWLSKSIVARFVGVLMELLQGCECHWKRFDQLFQLLLGFASCGQKEAVYLIRCGLVLRLVDIYAGEAGGVPRRYLVEHCSSEYASKKKPKSARRTKMGDKYNKPNFNFLVSLLDVLIRSVVVTPNDDEVSDSDSDSDASTDDKLDNSKKSGFDPTSPYFPGDGFSAPMTLTRDARESISQSLTKFEMPRRDARSVSSKAFFLKLFDEIPPTQQRVTSNPQHLVSFNHHSQITSPSHSETLSSIVSQIISHLCFESLETSKTVCSAACTIVKERKAEEFKVALDSLVALLEINDTHVEIRTTDVLDALAAGIASNLKYEKESVLLLSRIKMFLFNRSKGKYGLPAEVHVCRCMRRNIKKVILDEWFCRPNTCAEIRQSILELVKSIIPIDSGKDQNSSNASTVMLKLTETKHPKRAGAEVSDYNLPLKRQKTPPVGIIEAFSDRISQNSPKSDKENHQAHSLQTIKQTSNDTSGSKLSTSPEFRSLVAFDNANDIKNDVFKALINIFPVVCEGIRSQVTKVGTGKSLRNSRLGSSSYLNNGMLHQIDSHLFAVYFENMRLCLIGSDVEKTSTLYLQSSPGIHHDLLWLLWKIDEQGRADRRPSADISKGEILLFYKHLVQLHEEVGHELVQNLQGTLVKRSPALGSELRLDAYNTLPVNKQLGETASDEGIATSPLHRQRRDKKEGINNLKNKTDDGEGGKQYPEDEKTDHVMKLLEVYVTSSKQNEEFNNKYMAHYYELLVLLGKRYEAFRHRLLAHENWRWSLRAFVLGASGLDFGPVRDAIFNGSIYFAERDENFRKTLVTCLTAQDHDGNIKSLISQQRLETCSLRLLLTVFQHDLPSPHKKSCLTAFVEDTTSGLSQLASAVVKFHVRLDDVGGAGSKAGISSDVIIEGLGLALDCIHAVLSKLEINQVRLWPEVDDMNFIWTQIATRTEKEWGDSLGSSDAAQALAFRAVGRASELLQILATIETVAEAENE